ncbi:hypothetical protein BDN72DRAFT_15764 [Pluteus cervinus]|uniref:Uncharacterized protein n=1 Tax=Pluteus cervinus TaxID=181527 RepID=A0ACD3BG62_9AGAR|nr:hypothetical protein BDN72DRAFT_15764 [Pluteus cervinus]
MGKSKKKAPVKPEPESEVDSEEEEEIFHVEVISKARVVPLSDGDETDFEEDGFGRKRVKGGKWEYFVKWADYASDENTWEPEENVAGCERLLRSFWTDVGYDNNDYGPGTVLEADEKWIKQQKKYSKKQIKADKEELRKRKRKAKKEKEEKEREEKEREKGKEKKKDKERESPVASSSKAKEKLASESSLPPKIKRKRPETESSDDVCASPYNQSPFLMFYRSLSLHARPRSRNR